MDGNLPARRAARVFWFSPQDSPLTPYIFSAITRSIAYLLVAAGLLAASGCGSGGANTPTIPTTTTQTDPPPPVQHHTVVATYHNDNARTGVNPKETVLTPDNVNVVSFGRLAAIPVEGDVYAQPLYLSNVTMRDGQSHDLVIVATQHDQLYAIDANTRTILWHKSFLDSQGAVTPVTSDDVGCTDISPEIGITGTPVIDPASQTVYLVVRTKESRNGQAAFYQRLHAIDLTTGQDRLSPFVILNPSREDGSFGSAKFDPQLNNQRSALLLVGEQIFVAWATHCDVGGSSGWLMSFSAQTLERVAAWTPAPSGTLGGIWMSGGGPSADGNGNIFLAVGNGVSDAMLGGSNYGDSVVRLTEGGNTLGVMDYFIPFDFQWRFDDDVDFGSGSTVLFPTQSGAPHPNLLVVASKDGKAYLLDRDDLGKWRMDDNSQIVQSFMGGGQASFGTPALWNNILYFGFSYAPLEGYIFDPATRQLSFPPLSSGSLQFGFPAPTPSISANGQSNGIVWAVATDHYYLGGNAVLRAYASNLNELYDSEMSNDRDHAGVAVKFVVPTVADGKVVVGTHNEVDIYGLLPQ